MIYWSSLESELSDHMSDDLSGAYNANIGLGNYIGSESFIVIVSLIIFNIVLSLGDIPSYNKIQIIVRK